VTPAVTITAGAARRDLAKRLARALADQERDGTPALDARILLAHAMGVEAARLALYDDVPLDQLAQVRAADFIARRIAGEPVARIVGRCAFWSLDLEVGPETLIPRPDTETVVEAALAFVDRRGSRAGAYRIVDIGTGTGAIVLALLSELPNAIGVATDRVTAALSVAERNARRLGLWQRMHCVACDWATAVAGGFDLVLTNPPYIESQAMTGLQVEVAQHDPCLALDGGDDGLDPCRAIVADLDRLLVPGGRGYVEVGMGQADDVACLAQMTGFSALLHDDIGKIARVVEICRAGNA
jgi:release factor glutamine methyltransferase